METTLIFCKPDAVQRGLVGQIIQRIEAKGLCPVGLKMMMVPTATAQKHYAEHRGKHFYDGLIDFITSGPVVVMAVRGMEAISVCRRLIGATNGRSAEPGTIRGDFGLSGSYNLTHASDNLESATCELALWFPEGLVEYEHTSEQWVYPAGEV